MRTRVRLLAVALVAGGTMFAQSRLSIGIGVGGYGPGSCPPPAYTQQWHAPVNNFVTAPRYVDQRDERADRDHDRDDRGRERSRGFDNKYQSRGSEHADSRGTAYSNDFRR